MIVLWLICDVSGSMVEGGKRLIARGLAREVEQYIRLESGVAAEIRLVVWNNIARRIRWPVGEEVPLDLLACKNAVNVDPLIDLVGKASADRFLILTDGFWANESTAAVGRWKLELEPGALRIIKVGSDTNPRLKGAEIFEAEEFFAAMDGWLIT